MGSSPVFGSTVLDSHLHGKDGRVFIPLILNLLKDGNGGGKGRMGWNGGGPSFNKFRMSGNRKSRHPQDKRGRTANGFPKGQSPVTPPYRRLRLTTFLQVAVQVRLCRAWYL